MADQLYNMINIDEYEDLKKKHISIKIKEKKATIKQLSLEIENLDIRQNQMELEILKAEKELEVLTASFDKLTAIKVKKK